MNINFKQLIDPAYFLARFPMTISRPVFLGWIILGVGLMLLSIVIRIVLTWRGTMPPVWSRWWRRVSAMFATSGFLALLFLFFRYEHIPVFAARAWMLVWVLGIIAWSGYLLFLALRRVPRDLVEWQNRQRIAKYLPKH